MVNEVVTTGAVGTFLLGIYYVGRLTLDWWRERRSTPSHRAAAMTSATADLATTNTTLLTALQEEREETRRLSRDVEELRLQNRDLFEQIRKQRADYEAEIDALRSRVNEVVEQLEDLQARLRHGGDVS